MDSVGLDRRTADSIYDVLVNTCKASERHRENFLHHQTARHVTEWRFMGCLGFGGKFWRTTGRRADGSWGELWLVNQYPEDRTEASGEVIEKANAALAAIR